MSWRKLLAQREAYAQTFTPRLAIDSYKPGRKRLYKAVLLSADDKDSWEKALSDRLPFRQMMAWLDGYIAGLEATIGTPLEERPNHE